MQFVAAPVLAAGKTSTHAHCVHQGLSDAGSTACMVTSELMRIERAAPNYAGRDLLDGAIGRDSANRKRWL